MCDLDLHPSGTNVLNGTSTPQGEQVCQIIFKSMQKCRSYDPDKLNNFLMTISSFDFLFNLSEQMFKMALLLLKENNSAKLF